LVINFDCPFNKIEYHHRVGRTGRYNSYGNSITFFQENQKPILLDILSSNSNSNYSKSIKDYNIDSNNNKCLLIKIKEINIDFINLLKEDYENINKKNLIMNFIDKETSLKLNLMNFNLNLNDKYNNIDSNIHELQLLKKKRRNLQFKNESLISDWVDVKEKIYNEDEFCYVEENIEDIEDNENITDIKDNENKYGLLCDLEIQKEDYKNKKIINSGCKKNKFCLFCDIFKAFEN
jgi:superfamily II DNA/RNA helicase